MSALTPDEVRVVVQALRFEADCYEGKVYSLPLTAEWQFAAARRRREIADHLEQDAS